MRNPTRPYCIGPASTSKAMMVQLDTPEAVASIKFEQPFEFHCIEIDTLNKKPLREVTVQIKAGRTLYFVADVNMPGWYFILMYSDSNLSCTCKHRDCSHKEMLEQSAIAA